MKKYLLMIVLLLATISVSAGPIGKQQAKLVAESTMSKWGAVPQSEPNRAPGQKTDSDDQPLYI